MKARRLPGLPGEEWPGVDEVRVEDRDERVMRGENTEMGLGRADGIVRTRGEKKMGWSEARAGWGLAITTHFTRLVKRLELVRRAKTNGCPEKAQTQRSGQIHLHGLRLKANS
jgi:hypothetical protein